MYDLVDFNVLQGKILTNVYRNDYDREIIFECSDGTEYKMYHEQDCCESVTIEDINGNFEDLYGEEIIIAEETSNAGNTEPYGDSFTWTFYKLVANKGYVNIRWYGESNGYYSEEVSFRQIK